jgi:hypothetical protein
MIASFDRDYLGVHRNDDCIFFQITLNVGRSVELKESFYKEPVTGPAVVNGGDDAKCSNGTISHRGGQSKTGPRLQPAPRIDGDYLPFLIPEVV